MAMDVFHQQDIVAKSNRGRNSTSCLSCFQKILEFTPAPGEDNQPMLFFEVQKTSIITNVLVHAVEVAGFQTVNFHDDRLLFSVGAILHCREDVGFFADRDRLGKMLKMALGTQPKQDPLSMIIKDILVGLELCPRLTLGDGHDPS